MWSGVQVLLLACLVTVLVNGAVVELDMVVNGRATIYAGYTNQSPKERMFYTIAQFNASGMLLSVDSGSRWPWVYSSGERHCAPLANPSVSIPCPNVPTYSVSDNGVQKNNSRIMFKYGAAFFSSDPRVSSLGGFYADTWEFALANSSATVPVTLDPFVGINKVLINTPMIEVLESGIFGCGPPCFQANATDAPCEPFFLGQLTDALDTDELFSYTLTADPAVLATGVLTLGAANPDSTWQSLSEQSFDQGLWYIDVEFAVGDGEFSPCVALVDTGGGPTYLPITDTWTFGRDCTGLEDLPSYYIRLPDSGRVLEMDPQDYVLQIWDDESSSYTCESSTLFASSETSNMQQTNRSNSNGRSHHPRYPDKSGKDSNTAFCVIGMWNAVKYEMAFSWQAGLEGVAFGPAH